jgi:hypothetical protein
LILLSATAYAGRGALLQQATANAAKRNEAQQQRRNAWNERIGELQSVANRPEVRRALEESKGEIELGTRSYPSTLTYHSSVSPNFGGFGSRTDSSVVTERLLLRKNGLHLEQVNRAGSIEQVFGKRVHAATLDPESWHHIEPGHITKAADAFVTKTPPFANVKSELQTLVADRQLRTALAASGKTIVLATRRRSVSYSTLDKIDRLILTKDGLRLETGWVGFEPKSRTARLGFHLLGGQVTAAKWARDLRLGQATKAVEDWAKTEAKSAK